MHHEALTKEGVALFPRLTGFDGFYLAGGTALALQIGHRVSVDFDLFSPDPIPQSLLAKAKKIFDGIAVQPVINNPDELTVLAGVVKVTFLSYPFPLLASLVTVDGFKLLSIKEIAATKAYSIGRRGTYKDYVDLYFILKGKYASLNDIISMAEQKFGIDFNSRLFAEQLLFMDDIKDYEITFLAESVNAEDILGFFKSELEKIIIK
jgi:hypothetical protein